MVEVHYVYYGFLHVEEDFDFTAVFVDSGLKVRGFVAAVIFYDFMRGGRPFRGGMGVVTLKD